MTMRVWVGAALTGALLALAGASVAYGQAAEGIILNNDGQNTQSGPPSAGRTAPPAGAATGTDPIQPAQARVRIEALEQELYGACTQDDRVIGRLSGGLAPVRLGAERQLRQRGVRVFRYVYRATGCGRSARRHNIEVLVRQGASQPAILVLPPGNSPVTSVVLQGVFQNVFQPNFAQRYPNCTPQRLRILEANVASGTPYTAGQSWQENWRYDACGSRGTAAITFAYDGNGLRIDANVTPGDATVAP